VVDAHLLDVIHLLEGVNRIKVFHHSH
jgi:hypothetical protein